MDTERAAIVELHCRVLGKGCQVQIPHANGILPALKARKQLERNENVSRFLCDFSDSILGQLIVPFLSKITQPMYLSLFPSLLCYMAVSSTTELQVGVEGSAATEGPWNLVARKVKRGLKYAVNDGPRRAQSRVVMANATRKALSQCVVTGFV
jgi:hypothetical protein